MLRKSQEELRAANTRLEELSSLKDELVANVSHELRTPLTAIKEGISLMLDEALGSVTDEQQDFLNTVDENIDRLTELISNLLDLSKIEAGRLRLVRRRLDIRQFIGTTLKSYKAIAGQRRLEVELPAVPEVFADSNRVLQVLGNLFSNAVKFTKEDGTITFSVQERDGSVAVSVRDDGMGIPKDDVPKLFQKFSQVGAGENRPPGTGLGLVLCKELIELHKGTIAVASEPGKGSTFTFTLPVYTPRFALEESFTELVELAKRNQQELIAVIALDIEPFFGRLREGGQSATRRERLEQVADLVRKHVHHGDIVLGIEPRWVVVLAVTEVKDVHTVIQRRIRTVLHEQAKPLCGEAVNLPVKFGTTICPMDGTDIHSLFEKATRLAISGLEAVVNAEDRTTRG